MKTTEAKLQVMDRQGGEECVRFAWLYANQSRDHLRMMTLKIIAFMDINYN